MENIRTQNAALSVIVSYFETKGYSNGLRRINKTVWDDSAAIPSFKSYVNITTFGSYRSGKSALVGRLVFDSDSLDQATRRKIINNPLYKSEMEKYIWIMDRSKGERDLGHTTDVSRCLAEFKNHYISFINTPGKVNLIKNRLYGIVQCDYVLFVVDANDWEEQMQFCKDSLKLIKASGVKGIIVAINKIDLVEKDQEKTYKTIVDFLNHCASTTNIKDIVCIPVSAKNGDNICASSPNSYEWYSGPTLYSAINNLKLPPRNIHKPLRIIIDRCYEVKSVGLILTGTVIQGVVKVGQHVKIGPVNKIVNIRSIHLAIEKVPVYAGYPGQYIGINVSGLTKALDISHKRMGIITGFLNPNEHQKFVFTNQIPKTKLSTRTFALDQHRPMLLKEENIEEFNLRQMMRQQEAPLHPVEKFIARVVFFGLKKNETLKPTSELILHAHTGQIVVKIENIQVFNPNRTRDESTINLTTNRGRFQHISNDTLTNEILIQIPPIQLIKTIPLVSKLFLDLSHSNSLWKLILLKNKTTKIDTKNHKQYVYSNNFIPNLSTVDNYRTFWKVKHLKTPTIHCNEEQRIKKNESVLVSLMAKGKPLAVDTFANCAPLGRIFLRNGNDVIGAGIVADTLFGGEENEYYWV